MPSVTAISSGVRSPRRSPCISRRDVSTSPVTQLSLQSFSPRSALEWGFTRSCADTYVCSCTSVRPHPYRYEHMFPRSTPSPLTRRARSALSLARAFLLLEDGYSDWEVADEFGQDRSEIDGVSDRSARERAHIHHPQRTTLRGRSARVRAGAPAQASHVCLCPVERSPATAAGRMAATKTGRPQAARK
jgi:hypothetical protein